MSQGLPEEDQNLPLTAHLIELRERLIKSLLAWLAASAICYWQLDPLLNFLLEPLRTVLPEGQRIIFIAYQEAFFTYLKVALICGAVLASPVIIYQAWRFVAPGLYAHEKRFARPLILFSCLAFLGGAAFAYFLVFPKAFRFLAGFGGDLLEFKPVFRDYVSFAVRMLAVFGLCFEIPVALAVAGKLGLTRASTLSRGRPYAIVAAFVVAAILTPTPDVVNQLFLAIPLVLLYEVSILVVWLLEPKS
ncbi:twin-arginine translocase subunit TatC [Thermosulfurimonas sp. F29]|uniref:twin-arginine translocase subunit TatC n=1 Tax=Thermosulfurimonas sp. F29 TaxID=2867247 RepID=UPI001C834324|nr:twin-arginine translocase subunit TatC [Thermosulfurimonas sp. F29]MBX6423578.1 twin-arginine translocase subunit TatC [Thermosulfurimonas sp. F29]